MRLTKHQREIRIREMILVGFTNSSIQNQFDVGLGVLARIRKEIRKELNLDSNYKLIKE